MRSLRKYVLAVCLVAVAARVSAAMPGTSVPQSAQTLAVVLVGAFLGARDGALALVFYLLVGGVGLSKRISMSANPGKESFKFNQNFADDVPRWPVTTRSDLLTCVFTPFYVTQAVPIRLLPCRDAYCILP